MKALSIKQPWAWLIVNGYKDIENRTWKTNYRGKLLIHASKSWDFDANDILYVMGMQNPPQESHILGALVGMVNIVACVDNSKSKWFCGPWGFVFNWYQKFENPIPYRGQLGLFEVDRRILMERGRFDENETKRIL